MFFISQFVFLSNFRRYLRLRLLFAGYDYQAGVMRWWRLGMTCCTTSTVYERETAQAAAVAVVAVVVKGGPDAVMSYSPLLDQGAGKEIKGSM